VADGFGVGIGVDPRGEGVRCAATTLVHSATSQSRSARCANQDRAVEAGLPPIAVSAISGLRTIHCTKLLHLLRLTPRFFPGGNFERQTPGLVDE
jgi:hypothetical protein